MNTQEANKLDKNLIKGLIIVTILILSIPTMTYFCLGKFTFNLEKAMEYNNERIFQQAQKECGEWGASSIGSGFSERVECQTAPCKHTNIQQMKNCVREGYTGTGFLGMKDYDTEYYICEGYGRVALSCSEYWTKEDWDKDMELKRIEWEKELK